MFIYSKALQQKDRDIKSDDSPKRKYFLSLPILVPRS
jgi:hypothetical protein